MTRDFGGGTEKRNSNDDIGNEKCRWSIQSIRAFLNHRRPIFKVRRNIRNSLSISKTNEIGLGWIGVGTMNDMKAEPKNNALRTF